jgi:hypothetical protein
LAAHSAGVMDGESLDTWEALSLDENLLRVAVYTHDGLAVPWIALQLPAPLSHIAYSLERISGTLERLELHDSPCTNFADKIQSLITRYGFLIQINGSKVTWTWSEHVLALPSRTKALMIKMGQPHVLLGAPSIRAVVCETLGSKGRDGGCTEKSKRCFLQPSPCMHMYKASRRYGRTCCEAAK